MVLKFILWYVLYPQRFDTYTVLSVTNICDTI